MNLPQDYVGIDNSDNKKKVSKLSLLLRPFGYLLVSSVWLTLFVVGVGLMAIMPATFGSGGTAIQDSPNFALDNPGNIVAILIVIPLLSLILGAAFILIPIFSGSNFLLALTYFFRSLRPSYRHEKLSMTRWSGDTIGPVRAGQIIGPDDALVPIETANATISKYRNVSGKVAISLIPIRDSKFTTVIMTVVIVIMHGGSPKLYKAGFFFGLAYVLTIGWIFWPVTNTIPIIILSCISVALLIYSIILIVKAIHSSIKSELIADNNIAPAKKR